MKTVLTVYLTDAGPLGVSVDGAAIAAIRKNLGPTGHTQRLGLLGCLIADRLPRAIAIMLLVDAITVLGSPDTGRVYGDALAYAQEIEPEALELATMLAARLEELE